MIIWLTGLSGSGKTTLATILKRKYEDEGKFVINLDGDDFRKSVSNDLGFTEDDRKENIRRAKATAHLLASQCDIVLCSFIYPSNAFYDVYLSTPLEVCEERDVKGLYKRARAGEIKNFTGIGQGFKKPMTPNLVLDTSLMDEESSANIIYEMANAK